MPASSELQGLRPYRAGLATGSLAVRDEHEETRQVVGIVSQTDLLGVCDPPDADIRGEILKPVIGDAFVLDPLASEVKLHPHGPR